MGKIIYLISALAVGALFTKLQIPAGWLLGSLLTGIVCAFYIKKIIFPDFLFKVSLTIIGGNIGFMIIPEQFMTYHKLIGPFLLTLAFTLGSGLLLGKVMKRYSTLNHNTAFFCCLPGGASEVIALSKEYGADQQIVAAFHTTRITLFVFCIPFIVGLQVPNQNVSQTIQWREGSVALLALSIIVPLTLFLGSRIRFPGAALFFAIVLGFAVHQWIIPESEMPFFVTGVAQALMGAIIGMRFDRKTFVELRRIGKVSAFILTLYFMMSFSVAGLFFLLTHVEFFISLLSIVPAGAAEMASTATALNIEPTMVATLQMVRVLALFLALPFLIRWFAKPVKC